ncbi:hypothetical protein V6Z11_1Z132900 [Gossypium hirsutum]
MARKVLMMLIAASLLMGCSFNEAVGTVVAGVQVIHLGGKVMCQDCTKSYGEWTHGSQPIKGGKVSVTCKDDRSRHIYASDESDEEGNFNMAVSVFPHLTCNIPTNFAGGITGVNPGQAYCSIVIWFNINSAPFSTLLQGVQPAAWTNDSFDCDAK